MKLHARIVAWLLPLILSAGLAASLTGCLGKPRQPQIQQFVPPVSTVPKPPVLHPVLAESAITLDLEPLDTDTDAILDEAAKPAVRHHKPPPAKAAPEVADNSQPDAGTPPPAADNAEVPAIGVLSSGDPSGGNPSDRRRETADSINETEKGLRSLGRPLKDQEQKTAEQIREFIKQAKKALESGDVDGAYTLAAKAKVLLGELSE
ncbi:MAG: hypothetical protein ABSF53_02595 [Terracidiphilus sp.]|jgi:hypothetical protein